MASDMSPVVAIQIRRSSTVAAAGVTRPAVLTVSVERPLKPGEDLVQALNSIWGEGLLLARSVSSDDAPCDNCPAFLPHKP